MRARLLAAALTILGRDGPAAFTVRNITDEAGCSTTGVYTWFGSKTALVEAVFIEGFESFDRTVSPLIAVDLWQTAVAYRSWALSNPTQYLVMFGRAVPDFQPSDAALERATESFQHLVDGMAVHGADDPIGAAYHAYASVHGYMMLELVDLANVGGDPEELYRAGMARLLMSLQLPERD
ncbi:MAG: TetR/AcrR family transcriptional regulator [Acidimicrobiales bacterium]